METIFISYSTYDAKYANQLYQSLNELGLNVFLDKHSIQAGENIYNQIEKALTNSSAVLCIITKNWLSSEWSKTEYLSQLFDDSTNKSRTVIPLLFEEVNLPFMIKPLKFIDFRDSNNYEASCLELFSTLNGLLINVLRDKLLKIQVKESLSKSIFKWLKFESPKLRLIIPELFFDVRLRNINRSFKDIRFSNWIKSLRLNSNILVLGTPGVGKSTFLSRIVYSLTENEFSRNSLVPFVFYPNTIIDYFESKNPDIISFTLAKYGFEKFQGINFSYLFIFDGLDEIDAKYHKEFLELIKRIVTSNNYVWFSSRLSFYRSEFSNKFEVEIFDDILELKEWDIETESIQFIKTFSEKLNDESISINIIDAVNKYPHIRQFLKRPFEIVLLIYLELSEVNGVNYSQLKNHFYLYELFYLNWVQNESSRKKVEANKVDFQIAHTTVAKEFLTNRGKPIHLKSIKDKLPKETILDSVFTDIFISRKEKGDIILSKFRHETLGEFLIAKNITESFLSSEGLKENLTLTYTNQVNFFIREFFNSINDKKKVHILNNLESLYEKSIDDIFESNETSKSNNIKIREQILYYVGRLNLKYFPNLLIKAMDLEQQPILRRSAYLSAILFNNEELEFEYLNKVLQNPKEDKLNRSIQLVYFHDAEGDIFTFEDNNKYNWSNTKNAILNRLKEDSKRNMSLRAWDIITLLSFLKSRNWQDKFSNQEKLIIQNTNISSNWHSEERNSFVKKHHDELVEKI